MNELTLDGKIFVSSKQAAEISGYAKDYVGQLCREGRIEARLVGRNWYVLKSALEMHRFGTAPEAQIEPLSVNLLRESSDPISVPRYQSEKVELIPAISPAVERPMQLKSEPEEVAVPIKQIYAHFQPEVKVRPVISDNLAETRNVVNTLPIAQNDREQSEFEALEVDREFRGSRIVIALCLVIMLGSAIISYVGTGRGLVGIYTYSPLNFIAGISSYRSEN